MDLKNWKTWLVIGGALVGLVAFYAFAAPDEELRNDASVTQPAGPRPGVRTRLPSSANSKIGGVERIVEDYAFSEIGSSRSRRNLFTFVEPPPPPPVVVPPTVLTAPPPLPPDTDADGVPDFRDNCPALANPDQTDIDGNGVGAACQPSKEIPPPPQFAYKYLGTFGSSRSPIATFSANGDVINVRVGETFGGRFILRNIGLESVDIGYVGYPNDVRTRIAVGQ